MKGPVGRAIAQPALFVSERGEIAAETSHFQALGITPFADRPAHPPRSTPAWPWVSASGPGSDDLSRPADPRLARSAASGSGVAQSLRQPTPPASDLEGFAIEFDAADGRRVSFCADAQWFDAVEGWRGYFVILRSEGVHAGSARGETTAQWPHVAYTDKMDALATLAGGVAHDFNNLLQGLITAHELAEFAASSPEQLSVLEEAKPFFQRGSQLLRQLMTFARREHAERRRFDVSALVERALERARTVCALEGIGVFSKYDLPGPTLEGDPIDLQWAIEQLLDNARKASSQGAVVRIDCESVDGQWQLVVQDDGAGMTDFVRLRATEPFFAVPGDSAGQGMGLSLVHAIVRRFSGEMWIDSEPGAGSRVRVRIPLTQGLTSARPGSDSSDLD